MLRIRRFWSLPRGEKQSFYEAVILLLLSNLSVRAIPFRYIEKVLRAYRRGGDLGGGNRADDIKFVNISLERAASLLPWKSLCLSRSIAAFVMLRRRGVPAVLYAGVKFLENSSLSAHAWVRTDQAAIEGESEDSTFSVVVRIGQ
jgi:Transglutaminase-like superfamily